MAVFRKCAAIFSNKDEDDSSGEEELEESGYQRRNTIQILHHKRALNCFMAQVLLTKIIQQFVTAGYIALVLCLPKYYSKLHPFYVLIPVFIWFFIFVWVHFVKSAPHFLISLCLLFIASLTIGYFVAEVHRLIRFYFMFLPATLGCLIVTNIFFLPFLIISKWWLNTKQMLFYLVPQFINLGFNLIIIGGWCYAIIANKVYIEELQVRSKLDAILLLTVPTLFWSASLTLLMANSLKRVVNGELYFVTHQKGDFIFAPLYFI